jgi:signal peptidase I
VTPDVSGPEPDGPALHDTTLLTPTTPTATDASGGGPPDVPDLPTDDGDGPARPAPSRRDRTRRLVIEWLVLIVAALAIAFLIKTFLFQAFYIPSGSMEPTLQIGDRVLVNKLSYDFHDVHRGDIIVFSAPPSARSGGIDDLVKRAIGLPGDTVTTRSNGSVYINGRRLSEPYLPKNTPTTMNSNPPGCGAPADGSVGCVVPKGDLFMLGDNRTESKDGRFFGPIPESTIVGRVFVRIWPLGSLSFL